MHASRARTLPGELATAALAVGLSLAIRWPALAKPLVVADDVIHDPWGHLISQRPVQALELGFWQTVAGPDYLLGRLPVVAAHVYLGLLVWGLARLVRLWGGGWKSQAAVAALVVTSPALNPYVAWNVFVGVTLFAALAVWAFVASRRDGRAGWILATGMLFLAISGYQLVLGLYFGIALLAMCLANRGPLFTYVRRQALVMLSATVLFFIYVRVAEAFDVRAWGERGLVGLSDLASGAFWRAKYHGIANMVANLYQPTLGACLGVAAAQKFGFYAHGVVGAVVGGLCHLRGGSLGPSARSLLTYLVVPVACGAALLPLSVTPSGLRIEGPALIVACLAAVLLVRGRATAHGTPRARGAVLLLALVAVVLPSAWTAQSEMALRVEAAEIDAWLLEQIAAPGMLATDATEAHLIVADPALLLRSLSNERAAMGDREVTVNYTSLASFSFANTVGYGFTDAFLEKRDGREGLTWKVERGPYEKGACATPMRTRHFARSGVQVSLTKVGPNAFRACVDRLDRHP